MHGLPNSIWSQYKKKVLHLNLKRNLQLNPTTWQMLPDLSCKGQKPLPQTNQHTNRHLQCSEGEMQFSLTNKIKNLNLNNTCWPFPLNPTRTQLTNSYQNNKYLLPEK